MQILHQNICLIIFINLEDGNYTFKAYAQDTRGNVNMTERNIEVADLTSPQIKFEDLTPGNENLDQDFIPINVSASDINGGR